jgi:DNA-binding response OmpR family regulator
MRSGKTYEDSGGERMMEQARLAKVLVVDDDQDHCLMLEVALECLGYEVALAHSYAQAVARLRNADVDALICDLTLGDGTALDVLRSAGARRPRVSVVLSGFDSDEDREASLAAGFDAHLVKPTSIELLGRVISQGLRRPRSGIRLAKTVVAEDARSEKKITGSE